MNPNSLPNFLFKYFCGILMNFMEETQVRGLITHFMHFIKHIHKFLTYSLKAVELGRELLK